MKGWWQCPLGVCLVVKVEIRDLGSWPDLGHCLLQPSPPSPPKPTLDAPQGYIPEGVWTSFSFPGQLPGICCLALGNPLILCFGFFPGMPAL